MPLSPTERTRYESLRVSSVLFVCLFAVAFLALTEIGYAFQFSGVISSLWLASGLYLSVLLLSPYRAWSSLILAAVTALLFSCLALHQRSLLETLAIAAGDTVSALLGAILLRRFHEPNFQFKQMRDLLGLTLFGAFLGPACGAMIGMIALAPESAGAMFVLWLIWWLSRLAGVLVVAPIVLMFPADRSFAIRKHRVSVLVEALILLVGMVLTLEYVFLYQTYPIAWIVVPFLLWAALRFELTGVVLAIAIVATLTIAHTVHGVGPFASITPVAVKVLIVQSFVALIAFAFLTVALVVKEQRELSAAIEQSERRWRELFDHMEEFVFSTDLEGRFLQVNRAGREALGYLEDDLDCMTIDQIFIPEERASCRQMLDEILSGEMVQISHSLLLTQSGSTLEVEGTAETHFEDDIPTYHLLIYRDVTERNRQYRELKEHRRKLEDSNLRLEVLATTDGLTGLNNRRVFQERLHGEILRANRHSLSLSLLMLDVDRFKSFNDTFGHPAGDRALVAVAQLLQSTARSTDFVSRYGGEEFAILLPSTDRDGALVLAERFRLVVENAEWDERPITISIGVATLEADEQSAELLLERADAALYRSKQSGRNCVRS